VRGGRGRERSRAVHRRRALTCAVVPQAARRTLPYVRRANDGTTSRNKAVCTRESTAPLFTGAADMTSSPYITVGSHACVHSGELSACMTAAEWTNNYTPETHRPPGTAYSLPLLVLRHLPASTAYYSTMPHYEKLSSIEDRGRTDRVATPTPMDLAATRPPPRCYNRQSILNTNPNPWSWPLTPGELQSHSFVTHIHTKTPVQTKVSRFKRPTQRPSPVYHNDVHLCVQDDSRGTARCACSIVTAETNH